MQSLVRIGRQIGLMLFQPLQLVDHDDQRLAFPQPLFRRDLQQSLETERRADMPVFRAASRDANAHSARLQPGVDIADS